MSEREELERLRKLKRLQELESRASGGSQASPEREPIEAPTQPVRLGRGFADIYQGVKQKYLNWTDPEAAEAYTKEKNLELGLYERGRQAGGQEGFDVDRLTGSALPFMVAPAGGAGLVSRAAAGAGAGGLAGYGLYSQSNDPLENALRGGVGATAGGLMNAAAPSVARGVVRGAQAGKNALTSVLRRVAAPSDDTVRAALNRAGINVGGMQDDIQARILTDAREQLVAGGKLSPEQLLRRADIETIAGPGTATRGQLTRDPASWTQEQNLQRTEVNLPSVQRGEVPTLTQRFQQQGQAIERATAQIADDVSGGVPVSQRPGSNLQASELAIKAIQRQDEAAEKAVSNLYQQYDKSGLRNTNVPDQRIAQTLGEVADEIGVENIPAPVLNRLKSFGFMDATRTKQLTIGEADKLNRLINNNNPGFGPQSLALGKIKRAINESLIEIPEAGAAGPLLEARKAAAERFAAQRAGKGVSQAIKDVPPDKFLEQNVLGGSVRDLRQLRESLSQTDEGLAAWGGLKARTWESLIDDATSGGNQPLTGARLNRALRKVGPDRMKELFTPEEIAKIQQLQRGVENMTTPPNLSAINYSNTTPALMGMVSRANKVPGLSMITDPIERRMQQSATESTIAAALRGQGANTAARDASQQKYRNALVQALSQRPAITPPLLPAYLEQQNGR